MFPALIVIIISFFIHFFRQINFNSLPSHLRSRFSRAVPVIAILLVSIFFIFGYITTIKLVNNEKINLKDEALLTLISLKTAIEGKISKVDAAVSTLCGSPAVLDFFENPTENNLEDLNATLDRYNNAFNVAVVYLIDSNGTTIASSNRNSKQSFVGENYSFREYFKHAINGKKYGNFAIGVTSGQKGYYSSAVVKNTKDQVLGVAVMKFDLQQFDSLFQYAPYAVLVDQDNLIFLSSNPDLNMRPLYPTNKSQFDNIANQHIPGTFSHKPLISKRYATNEVIIDQKIFLETITPLQVPGWHLAHYSSKGAIFKYQLLGFTITLALVFCVFFLFNHFALNQLKKWAANISISENLFRTIFENAPEALIICESKSGLIVSVNSLTSSLLKYCTGNIIDILQPADSKGSFELPLTSEQVKGLFTCSLSGHTLYLSVSSALIQFQNKSCIVLFLRDMTDIIKTQNALEESEQRYRELTDFLPDAVFELDLNGNITFANKRAFELFGYEASDLNHNFKAIDMVIAKDQPIAMANLKRIFSGCTQVHYEYTGVHKSGKQFPVMIHSTPIIRNNKVVGICGICIDLTDRIRFENEMLKKDKLEALGILAGGIAHDFNNLLTAIWSGFSLIRLKSESDPEKLEIIRDIENALKRGRDLTGQLLTYSKGGAPIKEAASLELLVKETAAFTTSGTHVKCKIDCQQDLYFAEVDTTQISQVIQNLLINAIEAMPQGGIVYISLSNTENPVVGNVDLSPGKFIEITVSDSGTGIPSQIQQRIFDPFFTTKPKGTGLGLATSYSIIKKHNGHIYFDSTVNTGTTFHVLLPASSSIAFNKICDDEISINATGKILIMDDEMMILTVTKQLLMYLGYSVDTASSGEAAIELYKNALENKNRYDALILDLTIPAGMGGKETIASLLKIDPQVRALVSSGYSNDPIMASYSEFGFKGVISKPYTVKELSDALRAIITS